MRTDIQRRVQRDAEKDSSVVSCPCATYLVAEFAGRIEVSASAGMKKSEAAVEKVGAAVADPDAGTPGAGVTKWDCCAAQQGSRLAYVLH